MKKFNKFAAAAAAFALAVSSAGCSAPSAVTIGSGTKTALTIDGYEVPAGVFIYSELNAYSSAAYTIAMNNGMSSYPSTDEVKKARLENSLVDGYRDQISGGTRRAAGVTVNKGRIVNCTVVNCYTTAETGGSFSGIRVESSGFATNCVSVKNVDGSQTLRAFLGQGSRTVNCAFDAIAGEAAIPEGMPNAVIGTAESFFEDYANGDYTPKAGGPLVNVGADYDGMASVDLAGKKRKIGKHIDIGCYECLKTPGLLIFVR